MPRFRLDTTGTSSKKYLSQNTTYFTLPWVLHYAAETPTPSCFATHEVFFLPMLLDQLLATMAEGKKNANFIKKERALLMDFVKKYRSVTENEKTNVMSVADKKKKWDQLGEFSSKSDVGLHTEQQLLKSWDKLKEKWRGAETIGTKEWFQTGAKRERASANPADSTGDVDALEESSMEPNTVEQMESAEPTSSALAETALAGQKTARASELEEEVKARREAIEEERKLRREEHFFRMRMLRAEAKERKAINDQKLKNAQAKARLLKLKVKLLNKQQQ